MGRIFNSYYPVSLETESSATIMANKIAEISNGKLSVYRVTSSRSILLQYLNTNLILEIIAGTNDAIGYFGSIQSGSYVRTNTSNFSLCNYGSSGCLRICYSEIDDTLCCLTVLRSDTYKGSLSEASYTLNFTIANTIINNEYYLLCVGGKYTNSFFGIDDLYYCSHFTMEGNYVGATEKGTVLSSFSSLKLYSYNSGTALLIPYYFVANDTAHRLVGEIQFSGQNGKRLYALLPPTSDGLVDPRENYIINGTSYKACGDIIKLFL